MKSDADESVLQELCEATQLASPVFDSIANPVSIAASVERAP